MTTATCPETDRFQLAPPIGVDSLAGTRLFGLSVEQPKPASTNGGQGSGSHVALSLLARDDDPLVTAAERVPLAWPRAGQPASIEKASVSGVRPFGLRFAVGVPAGVPLPHWRYCPDRQIAVGDDGEPWYRSLVDGTMKTTGPSTDGGPSTGGEEWTPDFMSDETG